MWAVAGPPRSGTTVMLEALAAWTPLRVRWDLGAEWESRAQTGFRGVFREAAPPGLGCAGPLDVVKVLDPSAVVDPERVVLLRRDPRDVSVSTARIGRPLSVGEATARFAEHEARWAGRVDIVEYDEVAWRSVEGMRTVFDRLRWAGWPVHRDPVTTLVTVGVR